MKTYKKSFALNTTPKEVYKVLMSSKSHAELTGSSAHMSPEVGGTISAYDGYITGKNLELVEFSKIVQEWRADEPGWPTKHFSKITYSLKPIKGGTKLTFIQEAIPDSAYDNISEGWEDYYWAPLRKKFGGK